MLVSEMNQKLRTIRKENNLTLREFGRFLGLNSGTLSKIENGFINVPKKSRRFAVKVITIFAASKEKTTSREQVKTLVYKDI